MDSHGDTSKTVDGSPEAATASGSQRRGMADDTAIPERDTATSSPPLPHDKTHAPSPTSASHAAQTPEERTSDIDEQLQESLSEFDGKLLKERALLEDLQGVNAADELSGETLGGTGETSVQGADAQDSATEEIQPTASSSENLPESTVGTPGKPEHGGTRPENIPPDIPDGRDDDIVARQIREAAMRENDPELRKKLWEEYRRYKQSSGASTP